MARRAVGIRGAAVLQFVSKYSNVAVQLVVTAVLSRLVSPEEYGLVSVVTVFTALFQLFSDMGISTAIVQFRDLGEEDFGALFGFSALLAAALALFFCVASWPISWAYGDTRLLGLCLAAAPTVAFSALNMVPNGLMLRERRFGAIAVRLVVASAISGVAAIVLAFAGAGCYSLVVQAGLSVLTVLIWNFKSRPICHISFRFTAPLRRVAPYSAWQFGSGLVNYLSRNLDSLVIGGALGTLSLGYYDKAYKLTTYPMNSVSSVVASVVQPYMAEHQEAPEVVFSCWLRVGKLLSLVGAAVAAVFVAAAPEVVEVFYGPNWGESVPLFQALSVSVYFQMLGNPSGAFFQSLGRTDLMFRSNIVNTSLTVIGLAAGVVLGSLKATAACVSVAFCLHMVTITYYLLYRCMDASPSVWLRFLPEILTAAFAVIVCALLSSILPSGGLPGLFAKGTVCATVLFVGYAVTGQLQELRRLLRH